MPGPGSGAYARDMLEDRATESLCADCGCRCGPNVICGWALCEGCQHKERIEWGEIKRLLTSSGAKYVATTIRKHLGRAK